MERATPEEMYKIEERITSLLPRCDSSKIVPSLQFLALGAIFYHRPFDAALCPGLVSSVIETEAAAMASNMIV